jgi:hypothetical protein
MYVQSAETSVPANLVDARRRFLDALINRRLAPNPTSRRATLGAASE